MKILWRSEMSVDNGVIDEDHRHLILLLNRFIAAIEAGSRSADLVQVLDRLNKYAEIHFAREEALQRTIGFKFAEAHHSQHAALQARLTAVKQRLAAATDETLDAIAAETADLLRTWVLNHVLRSDLPMRAYFQQARESGRLKRYA